MGGIQGLGISHRALNRLIIIAAETWGPCDASSPCILPGTLHSPHLIEDGLRGSESEGGSRTVQRGTAFHVAEALFLLNATSFSVSHRFTPRTR